MRIVVVVQPEAELLEIVLALRPPGRLAGLLDRREEQSDEHADDRDDHEQFDQGKTRVLPGVSHSENRCFESFPALF